MNGIFYILRTGCQWKSLPRCYGAPSTVHDRFQEWRDDGLFKRMWQAGLLGYENEKGLECDMLIRCCTECIVENPSKVFDYQSSIWE
jgi:transposase